MSIKKVHEEIWKTLIGALCFGGILGGISLVIIGAIYLFGAPGVYILLGLIVLGVFGRIFYDAFIEKSKI